jgi:hypothetical protein
MNLHLGLTPLISLLAGILILVMPRLLNYIVAIYLIVIGLIGLLAHGSVESGRPVATATALGVAPSTLTDRSRNQSSRGHGR